MPSRLSLFLIASLVANAALLGIVGGRWLSPALGQTTAAALELELSGPTSDGVDAAWAKLPESDRAILRQQLRDSWGKMAEERERLTESGRHVYEAALGEPYDEARLRDAVAIFQIREKRLQEMAEDILISHLGSMPPEARATAAVGLLTPFNARMQRADEQARIAAHERGDELIGEAVPAPVSPLAAPPPKRD